MLAKLFSIYALLGTHQVAAQLVFGTYKIINRGSQSRLCSDEAGEPIHVSAFGPPCAGGLWELGPGDDRGLYTIKNIGLNMFVQANEMPGSPVVTSNRNTSFAILPTEGHDHIIKLPDSDSIWTVVPGTISRSEILLHPECGDETQLWTLIHTNGTMGHWSPFKFSVQARNSIEEERNLAFLRGIEELGGSTGYQKYLDSPRTTANYSHIVTLASDTFTKNIFATGSMVSLFVYTQIQVTAGDYSGKGVAWGIGIGGFIFAGDLTYNSWDELTSAKNGITIVGGGAGANALLILFSVNGSDVAVLTIAGLGAGALLGVHGSFTWTRK